MIIIKPVIGITPSYSYDKNQITLNYDYVKAVENAGGIPVILPYTNQKDTIRLLQTLNGIILSGGTDIDPLLFEEEPIYENGELSPLRDKLELKLCSKAVKQNIPLLAICRGIQILCIAAGGTIYQDIQKQHGSVLKHMQSAPRFYPTHSININPQSKLYTIFKKKYTTVNSFHHQAVSFAGDILSVCATSSDGIIEAVEYTKNTFCIGVQWHPEAMAKTDFCQQALFKEFVHSASDNNKSK